MSRASFWKEPGYPAHVSHPESLYYNTGQRFNAYATEIVTHDASFAVDVSHQVLRGTKAEAHTIPCHATGQSAN